jgi:hypothetical protein
MYYSNTAFIDAYNASIAGDTIYLPGGAFDAPGSFDRPLTIIGAGFHPDSTSATLSTHVNGNITLATGADGISFEGIYFNDAFNMPYNQVVNDLVVRRCLITGAMDMASSSVTQLARNNISVLESILLSNLDFQGVQNSLVSNCIVQGRLYSSVGNLIQNNLFLAQASSSSSTQYIVQASNNNQFINNIFNNPNSYVLIGNGNFFYNNLFAFELPILGGNPTQDANYLGIDVSTVYVNQTGALFSFEDDYHLLPSASMDYLGSEGSEIGVYGGMFPAKEGYVPQNPHISSKNIAPNTDNNGLLDVQIRVNAQD